MGHVFGSGIFVYLKFIQYSHISFSWFFIQVTLFIIYHVDIIFLKATLGGCFFKHVGHPWGVVLLSGRIPQISIQWGFAGAAAAFMGIYVGLV